MHYYRLSADNGDAQSMFMMGYMLSEGVGAQKNEGESIKWFQKSAEGGIPEAQFRVARLIEEGKIPGGDKAALEWYQKAVDQGFEPAMFNLGTMYYEGRAVQQDFVKAFELYDKLAEIGDADALFMTARMLFEGLGVKQDVEKAMERFGRSANLGNQLAIQFLDDLRRKQNTQFIKIDGL